MHFSTLIDRASGFCCTLLNVVDGHGQAIRAVDEHRIFKLGSDGFDDGTQHGHSGATGEVAQPLSDIAAQPAPMLSACVELGKAGPKMAGKASEPFRDAWYPLSYICWDLGAKKSTGSGQVASWFSG